MQNRDYYLPPWFWVLYSERVRFPLLLNWIQNCKSATEVGLTPPHSWLMLKTLVMWVFIFEMERGDAAERDGAAPRTSGREMKINLMFLGTSRKLHTLPIWPVSVMSSNDGWGAHRSSSKCEYVTFFLISALPWAGNIYKKLCLCLIQCVEGYLTCTSKWWQCQCQYYEYELILFFSSILKTSCSLSVRKGYESIEQQ